MTTSAKPFYPVGGVIGADLNTSATTATHQVGTCVDGNDGTSWLYIQADSAAAIDQYDLVVVDENFKGAAATTANGAVGHSVAVATGDSIAGGSYGWVCRKGSGTAVKVNAVASVTADSLLYTSTTAGHVSIAAGANSAAIAVEGIVITTATTAAAEERGAIINFPRTTEA